MLALRHLPRYRSHVGLRLSAHWCFLSARRFCASKLACQALSGPRPTPREGHPHEYARMRGVFKGV